MLIKLFYLTLITVFIVDISGIIESIENFLSKILKGKVRIKKPFSCSLCMTWWLGLAYIIYLNQFSLINICAVALFAYLTIVISSVLVFFRELMLSLIGKLYNAIK
jgi:hypothetical protein